MKCFLNIIKFFLLIFLWVIVPSSTTKIKCPRNIKTFAAFPLNEHNKRKFYYDCDGQEEAILKSCKNAEVYRPELEECGIFEDQWMTNNDHKHHSLKRHNHKHGHNRRNRHKRQASQQPPIKPKIIQKRLGRNVRLGALYYGQNDFVNVNENIWDLQSLNDTYKTSTKFKRGWATISQNTLERLNNFDVDASLKASFLGGLVQVSGSARYLSKKRKSSNNVVVSYFYQVISSTESITQKISGNLDYPNLCNLVGMENGPTHVISSVTYGQTATFDFELETSEDSDQSEIAGGLRAVIDGIPSISIDAEANINITEDLEIKQKNLKCSFESDFDFNDNPSTFVEALKTYKQLANLTLDETDNILSFEATPIERYCDKRAAILNQISEKLIDRVAIVFKELEDTRLFAQKLKSKRAATAYRDSLGKVVIDFLTKLNDFTSDWKTLIKKSLPLIRGGSSAELDLINALNNYENSPFEYDRALTFLILRRKELEVVELALDQSVPGIVIDEATSAKVQNCQWRSSFAAVYQLNVLPQHHIVDEYINHVNTSANWTESAKWFEDLDGFGKASNLYRNFIDYRKINDDRNDVCFIVKLDYVHSTNNFASIDIYKDGIIIKEEFHLEDQLPKPSSIEVSYDSINFDIPFVPDSFTKYAFVTVKKAIDLEFTGEVNKYSLSSIGKTTISISNLEPNIPYQIVYSLASEAGKSSKSNDITISTNPFSMPTNIKISERKETSFKVSWERPHNIAANVTINGYEIVINDATSQQNIRTITVSKSNNMQIRSQAIVDGLNCCQIYQVQVIAKSNFQPEVVAGISRQNIAAETRAITLPMRLGAPRIKRTHHHTISLHWDPPTRLVEGSNILSYTIQYERIDPLSGNPLIVGNTRTQVSVSNEIILRDLAAGGTYQIKVKSKTTNGESVYSPATIAATPIKQTELQEFRESLNLPGIEQSINGKSIMF